MKQILLTLGLFAALAGMIVGSLAPQWIRHPPGEHTHHSAHPHAAGDHQRKPGLVEIGAT